MPTTSVARAAPIPSRSDYPSRAARWPIVSARSLDASEEEIAERILSARDLDHYREAAERRGAAIPSIGSRDPESRLAERHLSDLPVDSRRTWIHFRLGIRKDARARRAFTAPCISRDAASPGPAPDSDDRWQSRVGHLALSDIPSPHCHSQH